MEIKSYKSTSTPFHVHEEDEQVQAIRCVSNIIEEGGACI
jgi:hypothetical protein